MTYVITRPCCNDASCVAVCPANCIHPTPDEPNFATAEMLYIDPGSCLDCGLCTDHCPADAIVSDHLLGENELDYLRINADYYTDHDVEAGAVSPAVAKDAPAGPLDVAVVGSGPSAFYAAGLLTGTANVHVDMFEKLPCPYGLVRAGIAPDHGHTKRVVNTFARTSARPNFDYFLNVEVGKHISRAELADRYHAVIYAVGASTDKRLGVDGEDLVGSIPATQFVAWYNGHPDFVDLDVDLSTERAVVVGNGNVALDVARILVSDPDELVKTDIADHALAKLRDSEVREVVLLARRGVAQAAYTNSEFLALADAVGVDVVIDPGELALDPGTEAALADGTLDSTIATKIRLAREFAARPRIEGNRRIVFRYLVSPVAILGDGVVESLECVRNVYLPDSSRAAIEATDERFEIVNGMVLRAIGYRGLPVVDLPFDQARGVVPNARGRVQDRPGGETVEGLYVAGWIKRGASGGVGMNRVCGEETAESVLTDFADGVLTDPIASRDDVAGIVASRGAHRIDLAGWNNIDAAEVAAGRAAGRPRVKCAGIADFEHAALGGT